VRASFAKKVRQLQTRLQVGEDVFSYNPLAPPEPPVSNTRFARDNFEIRNTSPNSTPPPPVKPMATDDDDEWKKEPELEDMMMLSS
jgi:hypothetical protein